MRQTLLVALALLALPLPGEAAPSSVCETAVHRDYGNTANPRPKWAVESCRSVAKSARIYGVRPSLAVAVASAESTFRPWVVSRAGAAGVMQVKPHYYCDPLLFGVRWCRTRGHWVRAGVRHLAELLEQYDDHRALRSYNAGRRGAMTKAADGRYLGTSYARNVSRIERRLTRASR